MVMSDCGFKGKNLFGGETLQIQWALCFLDRDAFYGVRMDHGGSDVAVPHPALAHGRQLDWLC